MDESYVEAEISAQSALLKSIPINKELITRIDAHLKNTEAMLNEQLIYLPVTLVIQDHRPQVSQNRFCTRVDNEVWNNLYFAKNWHRREGIHEELSFERHLKGLSFFYTSGSVVFDVGVTDDGSGTDWYYLIHEDKREKLRVVGAPVEVKLRAFLHLGKLLNQILNQAMQFDVSNLNGSGSGDGSGYGYGNGNGDGSGYGCGFGNGDGSGYGDGQAGLRINSRVEAENGEGNGNR